MIKKEMVIMGCHRIGLGMNSVVKEAFEMFENEEIGLNACKKIIMACKNGVYWCDGYESDVIAGMDDYCGNCLRKFSAEELIEVDRNKYFVVEIIFVRHVHLNYNDDWTVYTDDGKLSAQWEHTFLVTEDGVEIISK